MEIYKIIADIQQKIFAPKNEKNNFGGFNYRTAEQILKSFKKVAPAGVALILTDEPIYNNTGTLYAIKSTATIYHNNESASASAFALIGAHKGMSAEQTCGAASSYARKYALCGLLAIDDNQDPDSIENEPAPDNVNHAIYLKALDILSDNIDRFDELKTKCRTAQEVRAVEQAFNELKKGELSK